MLITGIRTYWQKDDRNAIVLKNTYLSFFLKFISIVTSFILVSVTLKYVGEKDYGIVLTITSIINWMSFFDIGIGNGLRNKLGKALAEGDKILARRYVATAYYYIGIICIGVIGIYLLVNPFLDWQIILKVNLDRYSSFKSIISISIILFVCRFFLQLISIILLADQKSYINDSILPLSNFLTLAFIFLFQKLAILNLGTLIFLTGLAPVVVFASYSAILFSGQYKYLRPQVKTIDHSLRKDLLGLGLKFFLLQLMAIIIFSTSNILIAQLYSLSAVTEYNVAAKYYGLTTLVLNIVLAPLWGAFTSAWYQGDRGWIMKKIKWMLTVNLVFLIVNFFLYFLFSFVCKIWLGYEIKISGLMAFCLIMYNFQFVYNSVFSYFLNGIGKVNLQLFCGLLGGIINIPLTIWLSKNTNCGISTIVLANVISLLPSSIITTVQTVKLLRLNKIADNAF